MLTGWCDTVPYQAFACADGKWLVAGALNDNQWRSMARLVGLTAAIDVRYDSNAGRVTHRSELLAHLTAVFASQPSEHWLETLTALRLPCAPVLTPSQAISSQQCAELGVRVHVEQAVDGTVEVIAPPVEMSDADLTPRTGAALLGQHTAEVLSELCDVNEDELQQLEQQEVVRRWKGVEDNVSKATTTS